MTSGKGKSVAQVEDVLRVACSQTNGVLDSKFLCNSIGSLGLEEPIIVSGSSSIQEVMRLLKQNRIGCVVIADEDGKLAGIFSERDYVLKVYEESCAATTPVEKYMTQNPIHETPDCTIAFALSLMSQGGFRHLPIVDQQGEPIGMLSVKDMIDHIVASCLNEALDIELEEDG